MPDDHSRGRFLLYYPDQNLQDRAALLASQGFFDWDNAPPWDTWLSYVRDETVKNETYLITRVSAELLEQATAGIDVNPEMCILWAEEENTQVIRRLRDAGHLR